MLDNFIRFQYGASEALQFLNLNKPTSDQEHKIGSVTQKNRFEEYIQDLALYSSNLPEDLKRFGEFFEGLNDLFKIKLTLEDTSKNPFEYFYTPWQEKINAAIKNLSQTIINILKAEKNQPITSFEELEALASRNRGNLPETGRGKTCREDTKALWELHVLEVATQP